VRDEAGKLPPVQRVKAIDDRLGAHIEKATH
jgi:hypothetical protein